MSWKVNAVLHFNLLTKWRMLSLRYFSQTYINLCRPTLCLTSYMAKKKYSPSLFETGKLRFFLFKKNDIVPVMTLSKWVFITEHRYLTYETVWNKGNSNIYWHKKGPNIVRYLRSGPVCSLDFSVNLRRSWFSKVLKTAAFSFIFEKKMLCKNVPFIRLTALFQ